MHLTFAANELTASIDERTISGKIVPMGTGEVGNTSAGAVIFERDSIEIPEPKSIRLLAQHDIKQPLGRAQSFETREDGVYAVFSLSRSSKATDYLLMAQEGLVTGLSVGVEVKASKPSRDGVIHVTASILKEVSAVTVPAFESAQITSISAEETAPAEEVAEETPTTESETPVVENTTPVEATPVEAAAVEAARPTVSAPAYTSPRSPIISGGSYIEHAIKAAKGDRDSAQYVAAADAATAKSGLLTATADTADNTGLTLPEHMREMISTSIGTTAAIDAVGITPLIANGLSFTIPKWTQYPTVATTAENAEASNTDAQSDYITVSIVKKAGKQKISFELIDRSAPSFYEEVLRQLRVALSKNKDEYLLAQIAAGGTAAATTAGTIAGLQSFIATETTAALANSGDFANILLTSPDWWTTIKAAKDTTGRGLYNAINPMNANGSVGVGSLRGEVEGMSLYVDPFLAAGSGLVDNSAYVMTSESTRYWESPVRQVQINNLSDGSVEVEFYQYVAAQVVKSTGVRKFNLT